MIQTFESERFRLQDLKTHHLFAGY